MSMQSVKGKIAWVTGAGTGIGRAGAVALGAAGATVILSGRRVPELEAAAKRITDAGGAAIVEQLDIADGDAVDAVVDRITEKYGRLDILVNSAGLNRPNRRWKTMEREDWDIVIDVNLSGAFNCSLAALRVMRPQRDGLIINVSSMAGRRVGTVSGFAYAASKHGVNAMSESINIENCHLGIRACALCPGEVATEIMDKRPNPPSAEDRARMIQEDDIGETILFISQTPANVCLNEVLITPTWNRGYIGSAEHAIDRTE
jgi:NADP-dependent 3-hydroxy acid dehydrogenase YdfG